MWFSYYPSDPYDVYACYGAYRYCNASKTLMCICLLGFKPRSLHSWTLHTAVSVRKHLCAWQIKASTDFIVSQG